MVELCILLIASCCLLCLRYSCGILWIKYTTMSGIFCFLYIVLDPGHRGVLDLKIPLGTVVVKIKFETTGNLNS